MKICSIEGCNRPIYLKGLCRYHYNIFLKKKGGLSDVILSNTTNDQ